MAVRLGPFDLDRYAAVVAPGIEFVDHRPVGLGSTHGSEAFLRGLRVLLEATDDSATRVDDILDLRPDALLVRSTGFGTLRAGGGAYERDLLVLWVLGTDGLLAHIEYFDTDRAREALAQFDTLAAESPASRFANAAVRAQAVLERSWRERRLDKVIASLSPDFVLDDRRALVGLRLSGDDFVTNLRLLFEVRSSHWHNELLATRGERLALSHVRFAGVSDSDAEFEEEHLSVFEADASGRWLAVVVFDLDQRDAAYAELDARYAAGEAAPCAHVTAAMAAFHRAFASRDWDALAAECAPGLVVNDHRLLGWETLHGPAEYVRALRSLVELAPDTRLRLDHVSLFQRGYLVITVWDGSREGGAFEAPSLMVCELDELSRVLRFDQYDLERLDLAHARFAELAASPPAPRIENAATRWTARFNGAWATGDWERVAALYPPGFRCFDRRKLVQLELDREEHHQRLRAFFEMSRSRNAAGVIATRGDRLALVRIQWEGSDHAVGESEIEFVAVVEVDGRGDPSAWVMFDADTLDAAYAELDERYSAGDGAGSPAWAEMRSWALAFARRDWAALASHFPLDVEVRDHRTLGWGAVGQAAQIDLLRSLTELAPDVRLRLDHFVGCERGALTVPRMLGTRDGGAFEIPRATVRELDGSGRLLRIDHYDLERLDLALARFEELRPDPLRIPPNAATRAADRIRAFIAEGDWPALRALTTPDFTFDDRRKRALVSGDLELYARNLEVVRSYPNLKVTRELLSTVGDRISVARVAYTAGPEGSAFEGEFLLLTEVDAAGQTRLVIHFDFEDRGAAFEEAQTRFVAGEAAGDAGQAAIAAVPRTFGVRDWAGLRACFTDAALTEDHRRLGLGSLPIEGWIESLHALAELAPDVRTEAHRILAWNAGGRVSLMRQYGTREGGPFENLFIAVTATRGGRIWRLERFEVADAEHALARFAELTAG
jgi:ketosteroid isomerase-like protein